MTTISMSQKDLHRYDIIQRSIRKEITVKKAGELLSLSERQVYNLKAAVKEKGPQGLIHGNRGKPSNRRIPDQERQRIVALLHRHYPDFKPGHACEKLRTNHGIARDAKTIRTIMIAEGLWKPRKGSQDNAHRLWRQRKAFEGEMQQFDGSYHDWFEDRLPGKFCLLLSVDDATGALTHGHFCHHEGVFPVFTFWREYLLKHGKPLAIYCDQFSTYQMTQKVAQENHDLKTQFQRAMAELRIEIITAYSPEAKGRAEVRFKTLQDRLVKEMRLRNISSLQEANQYFNHEFIPWFNQRYAVKPRGETNLHTPLSEKERQRLESIFCKQTERTVHNDFTVSYNNQWYQLVKGQPVTVFKQARVVVEEHPDGQIKIRFKGKYLNFQAIPKTYKERKRFVPWILPAAPASQQVNEQKMIFLNP